MAKNLPQKPDAWALSEKGRKALKKAVELRSRSHSLYASIPIICKAEECPYASTCQLLPAGLAPANERCPLEIAAVEQLFNAYVQELDVKPDNVVDLSLIKELVDLDIAILRCDNKLAIDADFVQEVAIAVTPKGHVVTKPELHQAAEYKDKLLNRRHRILQLLHSTRHDKIGSKLVVEYDPSTRAVELLARAKEFEAKKQKVVETYQQEDGSFAVTEGDT
ncbi:hypothetical protein MTAT_20290 [Moorella thermoacetica]|uniref:Uncharacterized protein n=1 Tax=Neomoorella thermoacetica TaxID=1525 RepID=A0AAC9HIX1_NEOTH|nr:hypothetical protein [Moorella thermoacetica]AOQ24684.1 hypothetical protein Maut_02256 [Moorella thermoacetica]TYL12787.1 hypothetical protein MTAT_20290 [Moorella thermoacetica]